MTSANQPEIIPNLKWMLQRGNRLLAFGFGSGLSPMAPGTAGTLWAWAIFLVVQNFVEMNSLLWVIGAGALLGCWICGQVSEDLGKKDFGGIVWDEMIAFWLVLICIMPTNIWMQAWAFGLFRFFDAVKPGPIGWIDRYFKNQEGDHALSRFVRILWQGFGIMIDDVAAALLTILGVALSQIFITHLA